MAKEILATKRVCKIGAGLGVYFETAWGIEPGDLVNIKIEVVKKGGEKSE